VRLLVHSRNAPGSTIGSEAAFGCFQTVESVEQLHTCFPQLIGMLSRRFSGFDGKPNAIDCDPRLIRHFELSGRRPQLCIGLDHRHKLLEHFGLHHLSSSQLSTIPSPIASGHASTKPDQIRYRKPQEKQSCCEQQ
jgi:hypothetical protein